MLTVNKRICAATLGLVLLFAASSVTNAQSRFGGRMSTGEKAAAIGGGAAAGALIGGLLGGKKGAIIGGLLGAGGGTAYVYARGRRDNDRYRYYNGYRYNDGYRYSDRDSYRGRDDGRCDRNGDRDDYRFRDRWERGFRR